MADRLLLEDGTGLATLEDSSGVLLLESDTGGVSIITVSDNTGSTLGGTEDNELDQFNTTANKGADTQAYVDAWAAPDNIVTLALRFPLPSGSGTVANSKLRLYLTEKGGSKTALSVFELLRSDWSESQSTFNIYKTGSNWTSGGAQGVGTDRGSTTLATADVSGIATGNYVEFTGAGLDDLIESAVNASATEVNLIVQFTDLAFTSASFVRFRTSEGADGQRPELVYELTSGSSVISATANVTLAPLTGTGSAASIVAGTSNRTLGALTSTSNASSIIGASSNATLAPLTSSGTASSTIDASSNATLAALTSSGTGNVADGSISGATNATLAALTSTSNASSIVAGTSNATLAALSSSATAASIVAGTINRTLAALTSTSSASSIIGASSNATLSPLTSSGNASSTIIASSNAILAPLTSSAFGNLADGTLTAFLNKTLAPLTSAASASSYVAGITNKTLAALTVSGQASSIVAGSANRILAPVTSSGSASMVVVAGAGITLDALFSNAQAQLLINASISATLAPLSSQGAIGELLEWDDIPEVSHLFMPGQFGLRLTKAQHSLKVYPVNTGLNLRRLH